MGHVYNGHRGGGGEAVIEIGRPVNFTGGLEFSSLTYTVTKKKKDESGSWVSQEVDLLHRITGYAPKGCVTAVMGPSGAGKSTLLDGLAGRIASGSLQGRVSLDGADISPSIIKRTSAYIMQDDRLFPMLTVYETLMFAADFRLGPIPRADKKNRVEKLIDQLGLSPSRNTYIGDEGTRGVSGGERRRVSIGVDIIHGPPLLFLDEPTSGLDSTSAHSVIEKVHDIARAGSTVILTIHQPSSRIQLLLDHLIILARGQLMYQGAPKDVAQHLGRMGRKVPKGENSIEFLIDVIQEYDQTEYGVEVMANFALTGKKPPALDGEEMSVSTVVPSPAPAQGWHGGAGQGGDKSGKRLHLQAGAKDDDRNFDRSLRSNNWNTSQSWSTSQSGIMKAFGLTPSRRSTDGKTPNPMSSSPGYYAYSSEILPSTPTPHSSDYTAAVYAAIVWFALDLRGPFHYFLLVLFMSLLSTNSFVVFVSSVVPNYILGYAAVIAFTALFFLFCGYFLNSHDIPPYWKWMNKVSTMTYPYEGLLMNEFQTDESFGEDPFGRPLLGNQILESLHIEREGGKKMMNVYIMIGWAVIYRLLFYIVLRFFSKNQRT
nr:ABC transporter G family member 17-like [Ipomoea trifida]